MRCEAVPQRVRSHPARGFQSQSKPCNKTLDIPGTQTLASHAHEDRSLATLVARFRVELSFRIHVFTQRTRCKTSEQNDAFLLAFPQYSNRLLIHVELIVI